MKRCFFVVWLSMVMLLAAAGQANPGPSQQNAPAPQQSPAPQSPEAQAPPETQAPGAQPPDQAASNPSPEGQPPEGQSEALNYDKAIFRNPIPSDQLAFLKRFDGAPADEVIDDKQFRKLMRSTIPDCMFHYGHDMPLIDAIDIVLKGSRVPAQINGRYFVVSGPNGPYLQGRGFIWVDFEDGIVLGGFYFHPTNGEPTPAFNIFSKQVKEEYLALSQLPPAFAEVLSLWSADYRIPVLTTRYFITGSNRKILLEHDEDYCVPQGGATVPAETDCQQMNADAADLDMNAANYLEQTHHATSATAWMITGEEQKVWLGVRVSTCGDLLPCRIRLTRERVRVIIGRPRRPRGPVIHTRR
jgi:hypothetical protein